MTRLYFEKAGFSSFHKAWVERQELRKKFNIYCKVIDNDDKTVTLKVTSVYEKTQEVLRSYGFKEVKAEAL